MQHKSGILILLFPLQFQESWLNSQFNIQVWVGRQIQKNIKHIMICNPKRPDYIWRYIPRHDFKTFQRQLDHTEDQLIEFMPTKIARNYHDYQKVQRNVVIGFWVIDIPLVLYCNRIKFIQRVFSNRWAMFVFKMALVAGPLLFLMKIQKQARQQVKHQMYNIMKQGYQKYKRNGDILCLNPQIQLVQWKQKGENEQEK